MIDEKAIKKFNLKCNVESIKLLKDYKENIGSINEIAKLFFLNIMCIDINGKKQISMLSDEGMGVDLGLFNAIKDILHSFLSLEHSDIIGIGFFMHHHNGLMDSIIKAKNDFLKILDDSMKEKENNLLN